MGNESVNHYTPLRHHLFMTNSMCRYSVPSTASAQFEVPDFLNMELKGRRTAYFVQAFSRALKMHPRVNASFIKSRWGGKPKIVQFSKVGVALSIDKKFDGDRYPLTYVFQNSDQLSIKEIDEKLDFLIKADVNEVPEWKGFLKFLKLPTKVRDIFMTQLISSEEQFQQKVGSFNMTNLSKWGFQHVRVAAPRLVVAIGAPKEKKYQPVTYSFNHVICDGAQIGEFHLDVEKTLKACRFEI